MHHSVRFSLRWYRIIPCIVLALWSALVPAFSSAATVASWSPSVQVFPAASNGTLEPRAAVTPDGTTHLVWFGGPTQTEWVVSYTNNSGGAWASPRIISANKEAEERDPRIAVGPSGSLHVLYQRGEDEEIMYTESLDGGRSWATPVNIANTPGKAYEPTLAVDASGGVHAVWIDTRWSGYVQGTYAYKPAGGSWGAPVEVNGQATTFDRALDIATTGSGGNVALHIVYQGRKNDSNLNGDYELYYVTGTPGRFGTPQNLSRDSGVWSLTPVITSNGVNELYVAWDVQVSGLHHIALIRSTNAGASWTAPRNLTPSANLAIMPSIGFSGAGGGRVDIAWQGKARSDSRVEVYALDYTPATNAFGAQIDILSNLQSEATAPSVGASRAAGNTSIAFQSRNGSGALKAFVASRGGTASTPRSGLRATLAPAQGYALTRSASIPFAFSEVSGSPTHMRVAIDRAPTDADSWQPYTATFTRTLAPSASCSRMVVAQLRDAAGNVSAAISTSLILDTDIQAALDVAGIGTPAPQPGMTRAPNVRVSVQATSECSGLLRAEAKVESTGAELVTLALAGTTAASGILALPTDASDGRYTVAVMLTDALSNTATVTRAITLDTTPPALQSAQLRIPTLDGGLADARATLVLSNVVLATTQGAGDVWGVLVANTLDANVADSALTWTAVPLNSDGDSVAVPSWNVTRGLTQQPGDPTLAERPIFVRVRLIDAAGNASATVVSGETRLRAGYRSVSGFIPLVAHD